MSKTIPTWNFALLPACEIDVNRLYQRETHNDQINKIIRNFDYHNVNPVKVVYRDGCYYAFDGQHTTLALRALYGNNFRVPCLVYADVPTWCDEAALFEACNSTARGKKVSVIELWKSRLNRSEPVATAIADVCSAQGVKLDVAHTGKGIRALGALEYIYNNYGEDALSDVIRIIKTAWNNAPYSWDAQMLKGMAKFVHTYKGKFSRAQLINRLGKQPPETILRAGKASIASGSAKYAREILNVYNKGTSANRLADIL